MTLSPAAPSRREAACELSIVLMVTLVLQFALGSAVVKRALPAMPIIERAWVFFAGSMGLLFWLARRHGGDYAQFGVRAFTPKGRLILIGVAGALVALVVNVITNPMIESVFGKPDTHLFASLKGNVPVYLLLVAAAVVFGGFGEEVLYRGIILTRLRAIFGEGQGALVAALVAQSTIFALVHGYQGIAGMIGIGVMGFMYGSIFVAAKWNIWPAVIAHSLIDILGFTLLFLGLMKA